MLQYNEKEKIDRILIVPAGEDQHAFFLNPTSEQLKQVVNQELDVGRADFVGQMGEIIPSLHTTFLGNSIHRDIIIVDKKPIVEGWITEKKPRSVRRNQLIEESETWLALCVGPVSGSNLADVLGELYPEQIKPVRKR